MKRLYLRPTLDEGPGSNFLGNNLDWFEANWILELECTLIPSRILGSPNQELSSYHCVLVWTNWFSLQNRCHVGLASICHFLALDPCLKALGPIQSFWPIRLLEFIGPWILDHHLKLPLQSASKSSERDQVGIWGGPRVHNGWPIKRQNV
jgi:hypothetical protein